MSMTQFPNCQSHHYTPMPNRLTLNNLKQKNIKTNILNSRFFLTIGHS